jgi:hypothetical protein
MYVIWACEHPIKAVIQTSWKRWVGNLIGTGSGIMWGVTVHTVAFQELLQGVLKSYCIQVWNILQLLIIFWMYKIFCCCRWCIDKLIHILLCHKIIQAQILFLSASFSPLFKLYPNLYSFRLAQETNELPTGDFSRNYITWQDSTLLMDCKHH